MRFHDAKPLAAARSLFTDVRCTRFHGVEPLTQRVSELAEVRSELFLDRCTRFRVVEPLAEDLSELADGVFLSFSTACEWLHVLCELPQRPSELEDVLSELLGVRCTRFDVVEPRAAVLSLEGEDVFPFVDSNHDERSRRAEVPGARFGHRAVPEEDPGALTGSASAGCPRGCGGTSTRRWLGTWSAPSRKVWSIEVGQ
jgi:hypothetical protein